MDRDQDRTDAAKSPGRDAAKPAGREVADQGRDRHVRERVHQSVTQMSRSAKHEESSGTGIDRKMDRIASEQQIHTRDGGSGEQVRGVIERHRQEMKLAAISGARARRTTAAKAVGNPASAGGQRRLANLQKETEKDPGAQGARSRDRSAIRIDPAVDPASKARKAADDGRQIKVTQHRGAVQVRRPAPTQPRRTKDRGLITLQPPNRSKMQFGGNRDAVNPVRTSEHLSPQQWERAREPGRETAKPARSSSPSR